MTRLAPAPALATIPRTSRPHWWSEVLLVACIYFLYDGTRLILTAGHHVAFLNAHRVLDLERVLGFADERSINIFVSARPALGVSMSFAYAVLHFVVTPAVLIWLWLRRPERYAGARTALAITTVIALIGFWLFPTAPPRMLHGYVDTLAKYSTWGWWGDDGSAPEGAGSLTNQFAAMPSLHIAWAAWCGWQLFRNASRHWVRILGVGYPILIFFVVVGTGNHYVLDAAAGLGVFAAGVLLARLRPWARLRFRSSSRPAGAAPTRPA